ncbi:MAG: transporter substrate-binding domain-containing protein [Ignavibacteriaceae bacterium]
MKKLLFRLALLILLLFTSCGDNTKDTPKSGLDNILEKDTLLVLTGYNAYSYFIYKGQPMGFEHDLVQKLAEHLGVTPVFILVQNISNMFSMLNNKHGDLIAFNLTITKERTEKIAFVNYYNSTKQVLVQRKPDKWRKMMIHQIEKELIRDPVELIGKTIVVRGGSSYIPRLKNLSEEIGGDINIVEADPELTIEDLIELVANDDIDYTISDENIALLNEASHNNIDVKTDISLSQRIAWGVRKSSTELLDTINHWLDSIKSTEYFAVTYNRYYKNRYAYKRRITSEYLSHKGGKISGYDELIKESAQKLNWDWRLMASQMYQESQFKPNVKSWAGAVGLMQLLPSTAKMYGTTNLYDPKSNIKAGTKFLIYLDKYWSEFIKDSTERLKFVLASYNVGRGHIDDARRLTEKYGANPNVWEDNVEFYLLQKSKPKYYNDEVVRNGYCRGKETVKYVREIFERYEHYKKFIE